MAKVDLADFGSFLESKLKKALEDTVNPKVLESYGTKIAQDIRLRTQMGMGIKEHGGEPFKLKPLAESTIEKRTNFKGLSTKTKAKMSNLTMTGVMLESIDCKIENSSIILYFKDPFEGEKTKWNEEMGRPYFYLSRVQIERLSNDLEKLLIENIHQKIK